MASGLDALGVQNAGQLDPDHQGVGLVAVQHHDDALVALTQGLAGVILEPTDVDRLHA